MARKNNLKKARATTVVLQKQSAVHFPVDSLESIMTTLEEGIVT